MNEKITFFGLKTLWKEGEFENFLILPYSFHRSSAAEALESVCMLKGHILGRTSTWLIFRRFRTMSLTMVFNPFKYITNSYRRH